MAQVAVYWSISVVRSRIIWVQHTTQLFSSFCQSKKWLLLIKWQGIWSAVKLLKAAKCSYCIKTHSGAKVSIMQWHSKTIKNHCHFLPLFTTFYHFLRICCHFMSLSLTGGNFWSVVSETLFQKSREKPFSCCCSVFFFFEDMNQIKTGF